MLIDGVIALDTEEEIGKVLTEQCETGNSFLRYRVVSSDELEN